MIDLTISEEIRVKIEKKSERRHKKRLPRMKISGAQVKQLQKLIINKGKKPNQRSA